ncbi:MAG: hypothetical protein KDD51_16745 [Bdellovibrionales bacterium]|nr:hypothetical protein [Bdellovibrionales bacterium]
MGAVVNKRRPWFSRLLLNGIITGLFLGYTGFLFTVPAALGTKWIDTVHECGKMHAVNLTHPACGERRSPVDLDKVAKHLQKKIDLAITKSNESFAIQVSVISDSGLKFHLTSKEKGFITNQALPATLTRLRRLANMLNQEAHRFGRASTKIPTAWHITLATAEESELLSGALAVQYATKSQNSSSALPFFFPNSLRF